MADAKDKDKEKKPKAKAPAEGKKADAAPKKEKAKAKEKDKAPVEAAAPAPAPPPPPRPPADPRLKVLKKFRGRFLPRGPLRDRLKGLMDRWDSGEDHGGVTLDELKSLLNDWRASHAKPARATTR